MAALKALITMAVSVFIIVAAAATFASAQKSTIKKTAAKPSTNISLPVVKQIDTAALRALIKPNKKPLLINFWATWCDPCREEFPNLVKIDKEYRPNRAVAFITISLDDFSDIKTSVPKFLGSMKANMPAYLLNVSDPEPAIELIDKGWTG